MTETYRIGVVGSGTDEALLREALRFLLSDALADRVVCLGDYGFVSRVVQRFCVELFGSVPGYRALYSHALKAIVREAPAEVGWALDTQLAVSRLESIQVVPDPPSRAIDYVADRVIVLVRDKSVLDAEDVGNANLVVFDADEPAHVRRFGRRVFFSPGTLRHGQVGLIEADGGEFSVASFQFDGTPVLREIVPDSRNRLTVTEA